MHGYIDGKVEIFCGDFPPTNLNILWYKRDNSDTRSYYTLMEFDQAKSTWVELNTSSRYFITATEDGVEYELITNDNEQLIIE